MHSTHRPQEGTAPEVQGWHCGQGTPGEGRHLHQRTKSLQVVLPHQKEVMVASVSRFSAFNITQLLNSPVTMRSRLYPAGSARGGPPSPRWLRHSPGLRSSLRSFFRSNLPQTDAGRFKHSEIRRDSVVSSATETTWPTNSSFHLPATAQLCIRSQSHRLLTASPFARPF